MQGYDDECPPLDRKLLAILAADVVGYLEGDGGR